MEKKTTSIFMVILLCILIAILAGGGSYLVLANAHDQETQSLNNQIDQLDSQVKKLQTEAKTTAETTTTATATPAPTSTATPTAADPTANWKTYTDTANKFSFKYPANWQISGTATETPGNSFVFTIAPPNNNYYVIQFAHTYLDYDNKDIATQYTKLKENCPSDDTCKELTSQYGISFIDHGLGGDVPSATFATGKYIIIMNYYRTGTLTSTQQAEYNENKTIFDEMITTFKTIN